MDDEVPLKDEAKKQPGNAKTTSNAKAVAKGQIDTQQILKNIETYHKKNGTSQGQALYNNEPRVNANLPVNMQTQLEQMKNQFQFDQMNSMNQQQLMESKHPQMYMMGNQMMPANNPYGQQMNPQMYMPTGDQGNSQQPNQTITQIDIIQISLQHTLQQQANPQQNFQQANIINMQNKAMMQRPLPPQMQN